MKLHEMRQILSTRNILLTKSLGQNFLHDANQLQRIVAAAGVKNTDSILEIGPGLGPLTELLLKGARKVLAIEKDGRLCEVLRERFEGLENFELLHADALDHVRSPHDWWDWKVVSNLPYSVASPILVELAEAERPPALMVVTLQLEVAKRIFAGAGAEDYGLLTLLIGREFKPGVMFKIPAGSFFPEPEVDSACITLERRTTPLLKREQARAFRRVVKRAFSQRRKMMLKLLKQDWPAEKLEAAYGDAGLTPDLRAEKVSLEQFVRLTEVLQPVEADVP